MDDRASAVLQQVFFLLLIKLLPVLHSTAVTMSSYLLLSQMLINNKTSVSELSALDLLQNLKPQLVFKSGLTTFR